MNKKIKANIAVLLTIAMIFASGIFTLILPQKAKAQFGGVVHDPINYGVNIGEFSWEKFANAYQQGTLSTSAVADTATAAAVVEEKVDHWATMAIKIVLEVALNKLLSMMTNDIIKWVNEGFEGKPAFLTGSFGDYITKAADQAGGDFVSQYLGAGWLCEEFDAQIKVALLEEHTFETESRCTLSDIGVNLKNFYDDFSAGGWKGWLATTAPQNNFFGAFLMAQSEKDKVARKAAEDATQEAGAGEGYLNIKDCVWHDYSGREVAVQKNVRGTPPMPKECSNESFVSQNNIQLPCKPTCVTKTTGSTVKELTNKALQEPIERTSNSLAALAGQGGSLFKPYIMAIGNALVNQLIEKGLSNLRPSGPTKENPKASLHSGETIREMPDLPANTRKEMVPILTLEQNLELALRKIRLLRTSQQRLSFLVREIKTSNELKDTYTQGNELEKLLAYKNAFTRYFQDELQETPSSYKPSEIFRQFDYLQPILAKVSAGRQSGFIGDILADTKVNDIWINYCAECQHYNHCDSKFYRRARELLNYFLTPYDDFGTTIKRIDIAEYDYKTEDVSDNTVETRDSSGTLIKTVETIIKKEKGNYPFGIAGLIDEGLFSTEATITTQKIGELGKNLVDVFDESTGNFLRREWQDQWVNQPSGTQVGRPTAVYSLVDWFVDITDRQGNSIDTVRRSNRQEVLINLETVLADFISRYENAPQQTEIISLIIEDALDYLGDEYIPSVRNYLDIYDKNIEILKAIGTFNEQAGESVQSDYFNSAECLNEPKCLELLNAEQDMTTKRDLAITKVKKLQPYKDAFGTEDSENAFSDQSDQFDDLSEDIEILTEKIVAEEIKLSQIVGDKDRPNDNSLQGFINTLDEIGPLLSETYYKCRAGITPFDPEKIKSGADKMNPLKEIW